MIKRRNVTIMITYIFRYLGHRDWTAGMEKQWRKTDAVPRIVICMSIPDLVISSGWAFSLHVT